MAITDYKQHRKTTVLDLKYHIIVQLRNKSCYNF